MKPIKIEILCRTYTIEYVNNPADVDMYKRESLWGQIDFWTRTIRIYDNNRTASDIFETLLHEIIEGLQSDLGIKSLRDHHDDLALLAVGLTDTLLRNGLVKLG